ncbi:MULTISPECIES: phosphatase PAP2 family protein [Winogradskyella]|uniref:phosphatase PAP2 family protein n=1 Tax=Winogradskyella TaxID=286104 RepID=UPI0015CC5271|nr:MULTISPECIES: phosphatase PAP2 family protein [Winogradskyella]QXP77810.1 phosphatase PAP2 family protein [Winogradskyella sp. HaHa_3_26]
MQNEIKLIISKYLKSLVSLLKKYNVRLPYLTISLIAILIVVGGINLFIELTENLKTTTLAQFDTNVIEYIHSYRTPTLTKYFVFITDIGDVYGYLIAFILCIITFLMIFKSWQYVIQLIVVMSLALSSNLILKRIINRSRPNQEHLVTVETLSYPSGHAMAAMAFYGFLIYLFFHFKINLILKSIIITLLISIIISIGISRIYLGVHFPSDIIGGFIAGFIWVILCALMFNLIRVYKKANNK